MSRPPTLYWDCETRSTVDLRRVGAYVYASHPATDATVARLAIDGEEPTEWRPGADLPARYRAALLDPGVRVVAHNAGFERAVLRHVLAPRYGWPDVPVARWDCTQARARVQALPAALGGAAAALGLPVQKDGKGQALMLQMCKPRAVRNGTVSWWDDAVRMGRLSDYCATDVKVERALDKKLQPLPAAEAAVWAQTEIMNDRGVRFDLSFVAAARLVAEETRLKLDADMLRVTGGVVRAASQVTALKKWLVAQGVDLARPPMEGEASPELEDGGEDVLPDMRQGDIARLLQDPSVPPAAKEALQLRLEAGKVSTRKLDAIVDRSDREGVVRGLLGYHGANTGRYISHGLQIQNFPRRVVDDWDAARALLDHGATLVDALAGPPLDVISRMLRGAIIPRPGHEIASGDYSSVEAVGVAWLAGQDDLLDAFRARSKVYEDMAGRVFNAAPSTISPDDWRRHVGKTLVLGAGYQMGAAKFRQTVLAMGGVSLTAELAERAVSVYRETYSRIPALWRGLENAAARAVKTPGKVQTVNAGTPRAIAFLASDDWLRMKLPSGRYLWYARPELEPGRYSGQSVSYLQILARDGKKWGRGQTYGGRLAENAVQGMCRDLLVHGTLALEREGYRPVALVHDEAICEPPIGHGSVGEQMEIMCGLPAWAEGFPLSAKGRRGGRYSK